MKVKVWKVKVWFLIFGCWLLGVVQVAWASPPEVTAEAAALMERQSGLFYYEKNATERRAPASLTKVMTCILALEMADPEEVVTVSRRAAAISMGLVIDLRPGEQIKLRELIKAALIHSANDATVAIAEAVAGDHDTFVRWMNAKALLLGLEDTHFVNTNGYSHPEHWSTAKDLARLTRYALQNPTFASLVATRQAVVRWEKPQRELPISNTNRLLHGGYPQVTGVKTGTTQAAGQCLIASARSGEQEFVAVVLKSKNRYRDAVALLSWGSKELKEVNLCDKGEYWTRLPVAEGRLGDVPLVAREGLSVLLPLGEPVEKQICLTRALRAPVYPGSPLGEVIFLWRGQELGRVSLVAGKEVLERPWWWRLLGKRFE
ncbi:Serine-type D-Ala-D-Ala carboxypeptidase [Ammonifex degensii KC4]|uniref:serine-type D-Ala-D-Ala carboxypeptidase n=1 Tax=Ammonifex degensii (strain DSM 10501 / KC4) TaxID=429009 RepID=C9RCN1_AMMDK|nr:D-alanyl-D-alanine carboxypeptidase family protein [Ammonifex degensii]ACX52008.1 Serine-type D-Ala-D-Ala carboxypeptidase [Ammonifex degensii KC4]